jgi:hypothetical protein
MTQTIFIAAAVAVAAAIALCALIVRRSGRTTGSGVPRTVAAHPAASGIERPMAILRVPDPAAACALARDHAGKTFDALSAPHLPMPACNRSDCQCRYERAINRRRGERRRHPERRETVRFEADGDRRKTPDRRRSNDDLQPA